MILTVAYFALVAGGVALNPWLAGFLALIDVAIVGKIRNYFLIKNTGIEATDLDEDDALFSFEMSTEDER